MKTDLWKQYKTYGRRVSFWEREQVKLVALWINALMSIILMVIILCKK